ncbi:glycosyltransferase family 61 protein [Natrinema versiforme]|uniref:glycosyltransferase family 61 protein n=1 Tax=Natrinema versiforme TaxID=88724 RepID=UPI00135F11B9|nr:glycosyltransferase family 61 protein [Natrinema versiforme]
MDYTNVPRRAVRKYQKDGTRALLSEGTALFLEDLLFNQIVYKRYLRPRTRVIGREALFDCDQLYTFETFDGKIPIKEVSPAAPNSMKMVAPGDRFVCEVPDVTLLGPVGLGVTNENKILAETVASPAFDTRQSQPRRVGDALAKSMATNGVRSTIAAVRPKNNVTPQKIIERGAVIASPWNNYYHWTVECLIRIRLLERYAAATGEAPPILVPETMTPWMVESLELMDYAGPVIKWDGSIIGVETLIMPTYPDPIPSECFWLRDRMRSNIGSPDIANGSDRIYISREDATVRDVRNKDRLQMTLDRYGFDTYILSELSVEEQVGLFATADVIVGPHGAGLTNCIYAEDVTIVELLGEQKRGAFFRLSQILEHEYISVNCDQVGLDLRVNCKQLNEVLDQVVS